MSFLSLNKVSKAYAGVPALRGVDLTVERAEIHALVGENGAGKSTLIKILAGVVAPDSAEILIDGTQVDISSPAAAHILGFRFIHQELNVVPALSAAENIFLGRDYPLKAGLFVDWRRLAERAREALAQLGIRHIDPTMKMARLSLADQMLVRISSAFLGEEGAPARLYVMDEPTASLTREESERLFTVLREIRKSGRSVLYVSHRFDEIMALCDQATVLRDGQTIGSRKIADISHDDLVSLMIGRRVDEAYPRPVAAPLDETALEFKDLQTQGLKPVSLSIRKGEIVGIAGLSGAGQSEILRALFGADNAVASTVIVGQTPLDVGSPTAAWKAGLAYVPRERRSEGLVLSRPIFENITLPHLGGAFLKRRREKDFSAQQAAKVRLKSVGPEQLCFELSGGNQQKVVFAKALAGSPNVLLLDEPTRGVDIGAKFDIYTIIREMTADGLAVLLASSDLPELIGMCDRIVVMRQGEVADILDANGLTEDSLINHCYGRAGNARPSAEPHVSEP